MALARVLPAIDLRTAFFDKRIDGLETVRRFQRPPQHAVQSEAMQCQGLVEAFSQTAGRRLFRSSNSNTKINAAARFFRLKDSRMFWVKRLRVLRVGFDEAQEAFLARQCIVLPSKSSVTMQIAGIREIFQSVKWLK